ncbi:MAG: carbohydrate ABC transporter permease, partial [Nitrososphaerales archaeon]
MAASFNIKDEHLKWLLLIPALALLTVFAIIPYLWTFGISFYEYSVAVFGKAPEFVGFQNYETMMTHPDIWLRFQNTAKFAVTVVTVEFLLGLSLALVLSERFRGYRLVLTICVLPMMIAPEITAMIFKVVMFRPDIGFINYLLRMLNIPFDGYGRDAFFSVVMVDAWTWTPFVMLMIIGGLSAVPRSVLEAAHVDGAGWWARFRYVIFPYARPFMLLALIFRFADALRTWEVIREWLDVPPPLGPDPLSIDMLPSYLYTLAFRAFKTSEMTATAAIMVVMSLVLVYTYLRYL